MAKTLLTALQSALADLSEEEQRLIALGVVYGLPIRALTAGTRHAADDTNDKMVGALKKLRAVLDAQGYSSARLQEDFKRP
jgi:hypothetical protein